MNEVTVSDRLTSRQRELVDALVRSGSPVSVVAGELGWSKGGAYEALKKQHVREYLLSQVSASLMFGGVRASKVLLDLLNARSEKVRLEAARDILDRVGVHAEQSSMGTNSVHVHIDLS